MTKLVRYTATAFLLGALAVGLAGASAAAGGNELQTPVAKAPKAATHNAEQCPLKRRHMYIEAPAQQDL